jgi:hypothetical protein
MDLYRTLWETSFDPERGHDRTLNEFFVFDRLITSEDDWVITPNNDTIYLRAFLDLRAEPMILVIPPMGDRQYWVPVSDMRHDFDANLSWDTVGARGGAFALCPPGWQGLLPEGVKRIDMGTPIIWMLPRIAVDGAADLPAAVALQKQFRLVPLSQWGAAEVTRPKPDPADFPRFTRAELTDAKAYFTTLNTVLRLSPRTRPPDGRGDGGLAARDRDGPGHRVRLGEALAAGATRPRTGNSGRAPDHRRTHAARRAHRQQLAGRPSRQADERRSHDRGGRGDARPALEPGEISTYDLSLLRRRQRAARRQQALCPATSIPPAAGRRLLVGHDVLGRNRLFVPNPIDRYSFGDRTKGTVYGKDGSFEIYLQHEEPTDPKERANWLPAPKGRFYLVTRHYSPRGPILTGDWTPPIATWAELSDFGGLLVYEVPAGPTGGLINDVWQRVVSDTGMVGPERGQGGKFLIVLEGTRFPENHGADFVVTSKTNTILIGTRILTPDPEEGERILNAHKLYGLGQESKIRIFEAPNRNWWNYQPRGMEYWKVVHQAIQLNPVEERDMAMMQGLRNVGIEKGKPFNPTDAQKKTAGGGGSRRRDLGDGQQLPEARSRQALGGRSEVPVAVHPLHAEPARPDGGHAHGDRCARRLHLRGHHDVTAASHDEPRRRRHPVPRRLQGRRRPVAGWRQGL